MTYLRQPTFLPHIQANGDYEVFVARNPCDKWEVHLAQGFIAYFDSSNLPDKIKEAIAMISTNGDQRDNYGWKPQGKFYNDSCPEYRVIVPVELIAEMKKNAYFHPNAEGVTVNRANNHVENIPKMDQLAAMAQAQQQAMAQAQQQVYNPYQNTQLGQQSVAGGLSQMQGISNALYQPGNAITTVTNTSVAPSVWKKLFP